MRLNDQKDTSHRELTKGKKTVQSVPMVPLKFPARLLKIKFQQSPVMLPSANRPSFRWYVPFNWKVREMKRALKMSRVAVDWSALG